MLHNVQAAQDTIDRNDAKADPLLTAMRSMTPDDAAAWVDTNVHSMADAKKLLRVMAKAISILARNI